MKQNRLALLFAVAALLVALSNTNQTAWAGLFKKPLFASGAPQVVNYQGQVTVDGMAYSGLGYFKFAVIDQDSNAQWSNAGLQDGEPTAAVAIPVNNGLFNVLLGDTTLANMAVLPASAFNGTQRSLRVWFSTDGTAFVQLNPDRSIAAVPYALQAEEAKTAATAGEADTVDGQHASAFQQHYAHVIVVAKSGGDFTSLTAALNSITDASSTNAYLIQVMPGVYVEQVTMKEYVDIEGAGEWNTRISWTGCDSYCTIGTVDGVEHAEMRFLSVESSGGASYNIGISNAPRLAFVTVNVFGGAGANYGIYGVRGSRLQNITTTVTGGTNIIGISGGSASMSPLIQNAIINVSGATGQNSGASLTAATVMQDSIITATGGQRTTGVFMGAIQSSPFLTRVHITVSGGTIENYGVNLVFALHVTLRDCVINATGTKSYGVNTVGMPPNTYETLTIDGSQISGATNSIYNYYVFTQIGATQLAGGAVYNDPNSLFNLRWCVR